MTDATEYPDRSRGQSPALRPAGESGVVMHAGGNERHAGRNGR